MKMVDSERRPAHVESLGDILDASTTDGVRSRWTRGLI